MNTSFKWHAARTAENRGAFPGLHWRGGCCPNQDHQRKKAPQTNPKTPDSQAERPTAAKHQCRPPAERHAFVTSRLAACCRDRPPPRRHEAWDESHAALAAGVTDRLWRVEDVATLIDTRAPKLGKGGPYKKYLSSAGSSPMASTIQKWRPAVAEPRFQG